MGATARYALHHTQLLDIHQSRTLDFKIHKETARNTNESVASYSTRQKVQSTWKYSKGLRSQSGKHLVNLCEANNLEVKVTFFTMN